MHHDPTLARLEREVRFLRRYAAVAGLRIHDRVGRTRIRIGVDSLDVPRLEFLDEQGTVVQTLPERR